jgi:pre-rRNA-processing protein IPI3
LLLAADPGTAAPSRRFIWSLAYSAGGEYLAAGSSGGAITLWRLPEGQLIRSWMAHSKAVSGLAFDPLSARLASCGLDAALRVWQVSP